MNLPKISHLKRSMLWGLKPFVKTLAWNCTDADPDDVCIDHEGALSIGDLRAAAAIRE